jgi:hypothetical protein
MITIDGKLYCEYADIPKPARRNILDCIVVWLENKDTPSTLLVTRVFLGIAAIYFVAQVIRCLVNQ